MLSKQILQDLARLTRFKLHQQEKHYLQTLILSSLYAAVTDELIFKGGTALFFSLGLPRFSEDLDFTLSKEIDFQSVTERIHRDLELIGVKNEIRKREHSTVSLSCKIAAEGPLFNREIERCFVSIEISTREEVEQKITKEIISPYPDVLPFTVIIMGEEEILAEKVRAIMTRNYARDVFDLHFLLSKNIVVRRSLIEKKLLYYPKKFTIKGFREKISEKKEIWEAELKPLVIGSLLPFSAVKKLIMEKMKKAKE